MLTVNRRFVTIFYTYLTLTSQNYTIYDSMVLPLLKIDAYTVREDVIVPPDRDRLMEEKSNLSTIEDIIEISKNRPKQIRVYPLGLF